METIAQGKVGTKPSQLSSMPPAAGAGVDDYNINHVKPAFPCVLASVCFFTSTDASYYSRHEAAQNTALRPESQEMAEGKGTAGDDLAI